jgi:hypothetical protein
MLTGALLETTADPPVSVPDALPDALPDDLLSAAINDWVDRLARFDRDVSDAERINYVRQAPGWEVRPEPGPRHTLRITTPTGHGYRSTAPPPPGHPRSERRRPALRATVARRRRVG